MSDIRSTISRRKFLRAAAAAAAGAAVLATPRGRAFAGPPTPALPRFVGDLDVSRIDHADLLWEWQNYMVDLGPRFTGSPQHVAYLDFLEEECHKAGLVTWHDPTQYIPRWDADYTKCKLALLEAGGSHTDLPVMSYSVCSGTTAHMPGGALVAPLVDAGQGLPEDFAAAIATGSFKGKIALVTEPPFPTTDALGYPNYYCDDPDMTMLPTTPFNKWSLNILAPQSLVTPALAAQAGCAGMIVALQATSKCARGQYLSFLSSIQGDQEHGAPGVPALLVDYRTGQHLKARLSALGSEPVARLVLPATVYPHTPTDQIVAFLPGAEGDPSDPTKGENIVVASHTDGTSASEEIGPLGMLSIARYFAGIPRSQRRRSLVFVFATGHFSAYADDTPWFVDHHPEILAKTAATMTIEHLGQRSYTDDPAKNRYTYDGFPEVGISYVSQDPALIASITENYKVENLKRAPVVNGPGFGVGTAFFEQGLPSYAYITGPNTLYQMDPTVVLEGTDKYRFANEVRAFVRILATWETMAKDELAAGNSAVMRAALGSGPSS